MDRELEAAAAASAGGWLRRRKAHAFEPGAPCANCETTLQGPYCHQCGQLAEDFHRSVGHLIAETLENFFHFDGRLWRTLPRLIKAPGQLTRDYLDGKRAFQIPPLRMFLVVLLLVFFVGGLGHSNDRAVIIDGRTDQTVPAGTGGSPSLAKGRGKDVHFDFGPSKQSQAQSTWLRQRIIRAASNPEQFMMVLESWAHRLAFLMLPIGALLLSLLFVFQRRFFFYDHLVFTMHSLSFQGLLLSAWFLAAMASKSIADLLLFGAPVHLFVHMRGTYGTSVFGTLLRMALLFVGSMFAFGVLMAILLWIGLSAMGH